MKDLVIGSITNYNFNDIKNWVNSLEQSGFSGHKLMMVYDIDYDTVDELTKRGFSIFGFGQDEANRRFTYRSDSNIVVDRFYNMWNFLENLDERDASNIRYVISTDVKDVIFQRNPSEFLDSYNSEYAAAHVLASSEAIQYRNEAWGDQNMRLSFPWMHNYMRDKKIYNAGVIAGQLESFKSLCIGIYNMVAYMPHTIPGGGGPDQAAYNILLTQSPQRYDVEFLSHDTAWAAQLGTTADPNKIGAYKEHIVEPLPVIRDGLVYTNSDELFTIVHQYNRVPELNDAVNKRYA